TGLILKVLERPVAASRGRPAGTFWTVRPETANRVRRRIEHILDWASVRGYRTGENPARWNGHLRSALPSARKRNRNHFAALPYAEVAAFVATLRERPGTTARALEFLTLTAARTGEVVGATWAEVDLDAAMWTIPAERMKSGKPHRVPLADQAIALLRSLPRE